MTAKITRQVFPLFIVMLGIISCKKSSNTVAPTPKPGPVADTIQSVAWPTAADIYFAGTVTPPAPNNTPYAAYWKNGKATKLTNSLSDLDSEADAIAVNGRNVYISGAVHVGTHLAAAYWKNGINDILDNTSSQIGDSHAWSIAVSNNDVYIGGESVGAGGWELATYWKNGVATVFPKDDINSGSEAYAIALSGADIYLAGYTFNVSTKFQAGCYWKNGLEVKLTDKGYGSVATSIVINGSDVYVAGCIFEVTGASTAAYWKNGVKTEFSHGALGSVVYNMKFYGSDLYIAGFIDQVATYWKNGAATSVTNQILAVGSFKPIAIGIYNNDIYMAGGFNGASDALLWKNGIISKYDKGINTISDIAVVRH